MRDHSRRRRLRRGARGGAGRRRKRSGRSFSARGSSRRSSCRPSLAEEGRKDAAAVLSSADVPARHDLSARFAPDGQTILYSAALEGRPSEIFVSRSESPESRPFGMPGASVLAISGSGEMALSLGQHFVAPLRRAARSPESRITGGATPREIQEDVQWADWAPDGRPRDRPRRRRSQPRRVSHRKDPLRDRRLDHQTRVSTRGTTWPSSTIRPAATTAGRSRWSTAPGRRQDPLQYFAQRRASPGRPSGGEVWFTAAETGGNRSIYAVTVSGPAAADCPRDREPDTPGCLARRPGTDDARRPWDRGARTFSRRAEGAQSLVARLVMRKRHLPRWHAVLRRGRRGGRGGLSVYIRRTDGSAAVRLGGESPCSVARRKRGAGLTRIS